MTIKVSSVSKTTHVAGYIAKTLRAQPGMTVQAIGAAAVNQAVKAVAIARGYLVDDGYDITMQPHTEMAADLHERTVVVISLARVMV